MNSIGLKIDEAYVLIPGKAIIPYQKKYKCNLHWNYIQEIMKGDGIGAYLGYNILLFKNNLLMLYHQWRKYHIALAI